MASVAGGTKKLFNKSVSYLFYIFGVTEEYKSQGMASK